MADVVNLRAARKRAKRRDDEQRAQTNRLSRGLPSHERKRAEAERSKAARELDHHRIDAGDGR